MTELGRMSHAQEWAKKPDGASRNKTSDDDAMEMGQGLACPREKDVWV